jgi:hypothetical protein
MNVLLAKPKKTGLSHKRKGYTLKDHVQMAVDAYEPVPVKRNATHQAKMEALDEALLSLDGEPIEFEYNHYFTPGVYTREMFIPAGTVVTGQIHRESSINLITKGHVRVVTDEDEYDIHAPHTFISGPGVKKALYCVTDVIWAASYPWDGETTDFKQLADQLCVPDYEALDREQLEDRT